MTMRAITAILMVVGTSPPTMAGAGAGAGARAGAPPALTAYVGHAPFEPVGGVTFLDHPAVRSAVRRAVADPKVRKWLLVADTSPSPPIFLKDGMIVSTGCRWHGCDRRNWAIMIDPGGRRARVCYFAGGAQARWYDGNGRSALRDDDCPSS
jgi:hypothetical protein